MKHIKTYKIFESEDWTNDTFKVIEEYMNDFCENFNIDLVGELDEDYRIPDTRILENGIMFYCFSKNKWPRRLQDIEYQPVVRAMEPDEFEIAIKFKNKYLEENYEEIKKYISWLMERVENTEIKIARGKIFKFTDGVIVGNPAGINSKNLTKLIRLKFDIRIIKEK